jgi:hypothetical protein
MVGRPFEPGNEGYRYWRVGGARRRGTDQTCRAPAMRGKNRCRIHGGKSTGAPGNRSAFRHGKRSEAAVEARKATVSLLRIARAMMDLLSDQEPDQEPKPSSRPRGCQL